MSEALKLYGFYPDGWGEDSFFIAAESQEEAFKIIDKKIKDGDYKDSAYKWNAGLYTVEVVGWGGVLTNENR